MKLGAHVTISKGYSQALERVHTMGGNALQIFSASPRLWSFPEPDEKSVTSFMEAQKRLGVHPIYFHASYLINMANTGRGGQLSRNLLVHELKLAARMGVRGTIVHLGSFKKDPDLTPLLGDSSPDYQIVADAISEVLEKTPEDTYFIAENAGNRKIGKDLSELATVIKLVNSKRLRVCLDTCHLYSAGYDLSTEHKLDEFLTLFEKLIGLEKLEVIHANDSRDPFNSGRDRHENLGEGTLTLEPFRLLLNHPKTKNIPYIIETPGFDNEGPDKANLDILKKLIA